MVIKDFLVIRDFLDTIQLESLTQKDLIKFADEFFQDICRRLEEENDVDRAREIIKTIVAQGIKNIPDPEI